MPAAINCEYADVQVIEDDLRVLFFVMDAIDQIRNRRMILQDGHASDNLTVASEDGGRHPCRPMDGIFTVC